jgi:uracil-DNA glycosylase
MADARDGADSSAGDRRPDATPGEQAASHSVEPRNEAGGHGSAADLVPTTPDLTTLRLAAAGCEACDLYRRATQTVFGSGPVPAELMLVGEQPGDREDLEGQPFVGPAGRLLDRALREAGIVRARVYVTNAVKHFKWKATASGKRRLHEKPDRTEVRACAPWLDAELAIVRPRVVVCLGSTAAQALLGPAFRVSVDRGQWVASPIAGRVIATIHPSAVLRSPTERREAKFAGLVADLRVAASGLRDGGASAGEGHAAPPGPAALPG